MSTIRSIIKKIINPFLKVGLKFYYRKPRKFSYQDIEVLVHPDVFPPHLTLSTKILLDFISENDLRGKTFLELGCGSGIISLLASKKGAKVTASDINKAALEYLTKASKENNLEVACVYSNLFENLQEKHFNYIIINPPYYPKRPKNTKEEAWFCGKDFEYFKGLFQQLPAFLSPHVSPKALAETQENKTYMILSEDCEIDIIKRIASENSIVFETIFQTKKVGEINTIFKITKS